MMEPTDGSPPNSLYMVRCGEMFPKPAMEKEDDKLIVPFKELPGEGVKNIGETTDGGVLALTNYRIFVLRRKQEKSVPLGLIDTVQSRDLFHLIINCKDANTVKCSFETTEKCSEWQRRITTAVSSLTNFTSLFAFPFYAWSAEQSELMMMQQRAGSMTMTLSRSSSPGTVNGNQSHNNGNGNGALATIVPEAEWSERLRKISSQDYDEEFRKEVERLQFNLRGAWRISKINEDFKLCPSYPRHFLVPTYITDETLQSVANFRSSRRIPVAVWRHRATGAIIARCSQPEVGWLGWRNNKDEELLQAFVNACAFDQGEQPNANQSMTMGDEITGRPTTLEWPKANVLKGSEVAESDVVIATNGSGFVNSASDAESMTSSSPEGSHEEVRMDKPKKMLIVDARSYASAVTNRARGGGCECIDYYPSAEIQFMNLANIHAVRKSFNSLRQLCASPPDMGSWLSNLEKTLWLQHLSGLLAASVTVSRTIDVEGRPVLIHCSDGWDRTPQIAATAQLCLDPYYRTVNGFKTLVEREWLSFGHKFGDRCGHGPNSIELNERCPVFLQWLDCVHQIHNQFPCSFEFSVGYLIKLAQHSHSCLFGTFLGNTMRERIDNSIFDRTYSVWPFLSGPMYKNPLYVPNRATVLWPEYNIRDLTLWKEVYLGNLHLNQTAASTISAEALDRAKTLEHTDSVDDGDEKLDIDIGALNLEGDGDSMKSSSQPVSPMSKTRSYGDLLEANGNTAGPQRRCSDPSMPIELMIKQQNGMQFSLNGGVGVASCCDSSRGEQNDAEGGEDAEQDEGEQSPCVVSERMTMPNLISGISGNQSVIRLSKDASSIHDVIPTGVLEVVRFGDQPEREVSMDRSSLISAVQQCRNNASNLDVMLESIDLRGSPDEPDYPNADREHMKNCTNLWHGSVDTSTDTLVPTNGLTEESPERYFEGSYINGNVPSFLNKRDAESFREEILEPDSVHENGGAIDCSVYAENSLDLSLLNNQSLYESTQAPVRNEHHNQHNPLTDEGMDISLMESVIQSQPLSAKQRNIDLQRHRRTLSNSKSEPSPHKFDIGAMSPSATINSRFSTPGGRSPNLTPPEIETGPVLFEKANNVIWSCPDGLAHALNEQNIRLQQIIFEHRLREEALQRELNATRLALLKRICYQCNNNNNNNSSSHHHHYHQAASPSHEESQNASADVGENMSVCSWEAVEGGASSVSVKSDYATTPIKWVPDHAVNKCTGCSFEFWIGRRKHHCRSCGKIFCSDCSEFFAPVPEERLYNPVRLCGPCYLTVTSKLQNQHDQRHQNQQINSQGQTSVDQPRPTVNSKPPGSLLLSDSTIKQQRMEEQKLVTVYDVTGNFCDQHSAITARPSTISSDACSNEQPQQNEDSLLLENGVTTARIGNGANSLDGCCNLKAATATH